MKISTTPTAFILIKARSNSEWDNCDFAIVQIDDEWKAIAKQRLNNIKSFKGNQSFYCHVYWDSPIGYFCDTKELDQIESLRESENGFLYLSMELEEVDSLTIPESALDTHMLKITKEGYCNFKAYGKHTGEEFWTESFSLLKLINP